MCCSAPVISYFCPRLCQPASIPASSQPAGTSLLLGQRLSKGIILLFPTPLFPSSVYFSFPFLAQVGPSLARPSPAPLPWRPSRHRWLQKSGRLSDTLTPTPQDKFINLLQLPSRFLPQTTTARVPWDVTCPTCGERPHGCDTQHLQSSSWHLKVRGSHRDGGHCHRPCIITQRALGQLV